MSISALFPGMEAYLDGDVEINNNVTTPEEDAAHEVEAADQTADIATDAGEVETDVKNDDVATQMLLRTGRLYYHVKKYGVDRTFLRLYNQHGEMDRMCGIQFPSCESMNVTGNPYSRYSAAFIAAMEDDNKGFWATIWQKIQDAWKWLKDHISALWNRILQFFGVRARDLQKLISEIEQKYDTNAEVNLPEGSKLADASASSANIDALVGKKIAKLIDASGQLFDDAASFSTTAASPSESNIDSDLTKTKAAMQDIDFIIKNAGNKVPAAKVKLQVVLNAAKSYATTATSQLKNVDNLKKDSENALKDVANTAKSAKSSASGDDAKKAIAEYALKVTNAVKETNANVVKIGKMIIRTINAYYKELRSVVKQLKPKDQPKEKPTDNAGGNASDKSGGDKNATAMFAFL